MISPTYDYAQLVQHLLKGERNQQANVWRGFLAGAIGGLIGTALKSVAEQVLPPRPPQQDPPPADIAQDISEELTGERLSEQNKNIAAETQHWLFGTLIGGAYGAAVEYVPAASQGMGLPFGTLVFGVMHEGLLPAAGYEEPHAEKDDEEERNELLTHLVYGFATELVRQSVRPLLAREENVEAAA